MKLYEIAQEYLGIIDRFSDPESGDDYESMEEALDAINAELRDKAENIGCLIKDLTASAKAIGDEIKALQARKKAAEKKADFLKNYMQSQMVVIGAKKIETPRAVLTRRVSRYVDVLDQGKIEDEHPEYIKVKTEKSVDKTEIAKALKEGIAINGAVMAERESLVIK